jgi:deoxyribodipyrimidine photo-lyase
MTTIVWFRQDLRKHDNPALAAAAARGPVLAVYILDDASPGPLWRLGSASRWWLHHSLAALDAALGGLLLRRGDPRHVLPQLAKEVSASAVFWNRCYEPFAIARDTEIKTSLRESAVDVQSFNGSLLFEPWEVAKDDGTPYKVYTPFRRACLSRSISQPAPAVPDIKVMAAAGDRLAEWGLLPKHPNWAAGWDYVWRPGEQGALARLEQFMTEGLAGYSTLRDRVDRPNVSRLSPHLHFGEIAPQRLWTRMRHERSKPEQQQDVDKFADEMLWREFSYHLLYHFPTLPERNWRPSFDAFPWRHDDAALRAWQHGQTGYPVVDAGMRELWRTGWMHNRARMVAASFLVKHLRIDWRHGASWFWDTLVDADLANNSASWQWVAGSGADASPYFRIFNPVTQGEKFDPDGDYVRRWCPELAGLPNKFIHAPFAAPQEVLERAGVKLGETYPSPIVQHDPARRAALQAYEQVKNAVR